MKRNENQLIWETYTKESLDPFQLTRPLMDRTPEERQLRLALILYKAEKENDYNTIKSLGTSKLELTKVPTDFNQYGVKFTTPEAENEFRQFLKK